MTCVECRAEMGTASVCARCGAPVLESLPDKVGGRASAFDTPASTPSPNPQPADPSRLGWGGCLLVAIDCTAAIVLVATVGTYMTQGSPAHAAQTGQEYLNLRGCLTWSIPAAAVLALNVVVAALSHVKKRRAT